MSSNILENSGEWPVRDNSKFNSWIGGENPILFVTGRPGAGKSYLATKTVLYLYERFPQDADVSYSGQSQGGRKDPNLCNVISVGYFHAHDSFQQASGRGTFLKSLAFQIAAVDPLFRKHVVQSC